MNNVINYLINLVLQFTASVLPAQSAAVPEKAIEVIEVVCESSDSLLICDIFKYKKINPGDYSIKKEVRNPRT